MATKRDKREQRQSAARRRAETHASGFETTILRLPDGVGFFDLKTGTHRVDIVPYKAGKGNPYAEPGELYYERTFWKYRNLGADEKDYVAPGKTFARPDPVSEYVKRESKNPGADVDMLKDLSPKERQLFLLYDHEFADRGVQLLEISYHLFGKLLDSRIKNSDPEEGWDMFYYPDMDGMTLRFTVEEKTIGNSRPFPEVTAIDFVPRKAGLPDDIANHSVCLDDVLIEVPYEKLRDIFLMTDTSEEAAEEAKTKTKTKTEPKAARARTKNAEAKPEKVKTKEKPKTKKQPTAEAAGLSVDSLVEYDGGDWVVLRISPDGTALTLIDDDDEIKKAVGVDEVALRTEAEEEGVAPFADEDFDAAAAHDENGAPVAEAASGDDEWDEDWD